MPQQAVFSPMNEQNSIKYLVAVSQNPFLVTACEIWLGNQQWQIPGWKFLVICKKSDSTIRGSWSQPFCTDYNFFFIKVSNFVIFNYWMFAGNLVCDYKGIEIKKNMYFTSKSQTCNLPRVGIHIRGCFWKYDFVNWFGKHVSASDQGIKN